MKSSLTLALFFSVLAITATASIKTRELKIALSESREVILAVPDGFALVTGRDPTGLLGAKLSDPQEGISLDLQFLPDPDGKFASARSRAELMFEMFAGYVDSSTEEGMQFKDLEPQTGAGTYCVFTDKNLLGKTELPPGEYLHLTTGIKTWPGIATVFRCFSNDTTSEEYQAILAMLRESVHEKPAPLK